MPKNRRARRVVDAKRAQLDARLGRLVKRANARRPPDQPQLTLEVAKTIAANMISSALARAQDKCAEGGLPRVQVFAVIVMSNHVHLVVRAPGKNLAAFMGYFKARIAKSINLLLGTRGNVWERRYDAQAVLDDRAALGRVRYTLENPQKARLVRHVDDWPGFVALAGRSEDEDVTSEWFDWTAWDRARRPRDISPFKRTGSVVLDKLPSHKGQSDRDYVRDILGNIVPLGQHERVVGLDKVLDTDFDGFPRETKRGHRPYAFGEDEAVLRYFAQCSVIYTAYDLCIERMSRGEAVPQWPSGTYAPGVMRAA